MTPAQRHQFIGLITLYTDRLPVAHAKVRLDEIRQHLERTVSAWIGEFDPVSPFYRIYSPVISRVLSPTGRRIAEYRYNAAPRACAGAHAQWQ